MRRSAFVILALSIFALVSAFLAPVTQAVGYGVHVLNPGEIKQVAEQFAPYRTDDDSIYVTVPFTLEDTKKTAEWQSAFDEAKKHRVVPLVRLTTRFSPEKNAWEVPSRHDILVLSRALNRLKWPQDQRHVILFNEPNHAKEWGGTVDPVSFAESTEFALDWFGTENADYVLLPAAADLAAPTGKETMEAFAFWDQVLKARPEIVDKIDAWNSHSYPNPGFVATPQRTGKNSLRGFQNELAYLKKYTDRDLPVYITETGWRATPQNRRALISYYTYAHRNIWQNDTVVAVTPFLFQGSPGPFEEFSFFDDGKPTVQWTAFEKVLHELNQALLSQR